MGLSKLDQMIGSGELKAKKHGHATIIMPEEIRRYLESLPDITPRADGAR
jgi:hypothetical protein